MNRHLCHARDDLRRLDMQEIKHGGCEIDRVAELPANLAGRAEFGRPVNDQWVAHAAAVSILFIPFQRRIAGLRPAPRYIAVTIGAADIVEPPERGVEVFAHPVEVAHLIEHAERTALLARAVVGHHDQQRIVDQVKLAQRCDQPSDLLIGMVEHRGERLLQARGEDSLRLGQILPRTHAGIVRREPRVARDDADLLLVREPLVARGVPSGIEAAAILFEVAAGRLMGRVRRAEGQIEEERTFGN